MARTDKEIRAQIIKRMEARGIKIPETDIVDAIKHGLSQSLPGLAVSAATGYKSDFVPDTTSEKIIAGVSEYAPDIAALIASGGAGAIAGVGKAVGTQAIKKALPIIGKRAYKEALKRGIKETGKDFSLAALRGLGKAELRQGAKLAAKEATKKAMPKLIGKNIAGSAAEGAIYGGIEGLKSPMKQYVNTGKVDPIKSIKDIGVSSGFGAGVGGVLGLASGGIKGISAGIGDKIRPASTGVKPGLVKKAIKETDDIMAKIKKDGFIDEQGFVKNTKPKGVLDFKTGLDPSKKMDEKTLHSLILRKNLLKNGIDDEMIKGITNTDSQFLEKTLNINTVLDKIQSQTGETELYPTLRKIQEAYNQGSYSSANFSKQTKLLKQAMDKRNISNASANNFVKNPTLIKTQAEQEIKDMTNDLTENFFKELQILRPTIGHKENYVPELRKIFTNSGVKSPVGVNKNVGDYVGTIEMKRTLKEIPDLESALRETDLIKKLTGYNKILQRIRVENAWKDLDPIIKRLELRGYTKQANMLEEWYKSSMGIGKKDYNSVSQAVLANSNKPYIEKIIALNSNIKRPTHEKVLNEINQLMYESWVGTNPRSWVKQYFQPHLVGDVELGFKYINKGARGLKKHKAFVDKHIKDFSQSRIDMTETAQVLDAPQNIVAKMLRSPGRAGMKHIFTPLDIRNRKVAFLSGYLKAKETNFATETFKTLNRSQKQHVFRVLQEEGGEKAAIEFGKIMADRINYIYHIIDKPQMLRGDLAKHIPFTTWGRNQWNLYYNDLINNPMSNIATKRAIMPLMQIKAAEALTGANLDTFAPASSMLGVLNPGIAPGVTGPISELSQGNFKKAGKEASTLLSPYNAFLKLKKISSGKF